VKKGGCDGLVMWLEQGARVVYTEFWWENGHLKDREEDWKITLKRIRERETGCEVDGTGLGSR
jgi:hypothetical protein